MCVCVYTGVGWRGRESGSWDLRGGGCMREDFGGWFDVGREERVLQAIVGIELWKVLDFLLKISPYFFFIGYHVTIYGPCRWHHVRSTGGSSSGLALGLGAVPPPSRDRSGAPGPRFADHLT